jgi:hypothetical protein
MYEFPEKSMYFLFNKCMIKYTKIIFSKKSAQKWDASYMPMRLICRKIRYFLPQNCHGAPVKQIGGADMLLQQ